jgi:hypothetical protein
VALGNQEPAGSANGPLGVETRFVQIKKADPKARLLVIARVRLEAHVE